MNPKQFSKILSIIVKWNILFKPDNILHFALSNTPVIKPNLKFSFSFNKGLVHFLKNFIVFWNKFFSKSEFSFTKVLVNTLLIGWSYSSIRTITFLLKCYFKYIVKFVKVSSTSSNGNFLLIIY